jgi:hypothetical protein
VVIAANSGAKGSDFLGPDEVLACSGAFNLYALAPERRITHLFSGGPISRGVDFVPHYSFAEYDAAIGSDPDLIVIPYLPFRDAPEYQTIMTWVRAHAGPRTILLSVCAGALNLADTGLLANRSATTQHVVACRFRPWEYSGSVQSSIALYTPAEPMINGKRVSPVPRSVSSPLSRSAQCAARGRRPGRLARVSRLLVVK